MIELKEELYKLLSKNPAVLEFIQSTAVDGMWLWDTEDSERYWISDSLWHTLGYERSEVSEKGITLNELVLPEDAEHAGQMAQEHYKDPSKPFYDVIRYTDKNNNIVYLETRGQTLLEEDGTRKYLLGIAHNITLRIRHEEKLKSERDRFEAILSASDFGTWEWNLIDGALSVNEKWATIIGYELEDLTPLSSESWTGRLHPDDLEKANISLQQHFAKETEFYNVEFRMRHKLGYWVWIHGKGQVIKWSDEDQPVLMVGTHQDISIKRKMEKSLAQAYRNSKTLIDQSPVAMAMFDTEMNYIAASPTWLLANGLEGKKFVGLNHYATTNLHVEHWKEAHQRALAGETVSNEADFFYDSNNEEHWIKWDVRPWMEGKRIGGVIVYADEITLLKKQEKELEKANELLKATNEIAEIGTWSVNLDDMTSHWSPATKRIHEVDPDYEATVETGISFYKEGWSRDKISSVFQACTSDGQSRDVELILVTAQGNEKWVRSILLPEMSDGKCVYIHGLFIDIDKQKKIEAKLTEQSESYKTALAFSSGMIIIADKDFQLQEVLGVNHLASSGSLETETPLNVNSEIDKLLQRASELAETNSPPLDPREFQFNSNSTNFTVKHWVNQGQNFLIVAK